MLKVMADANLKPIEVMTPAEAREQMEATASSRKAEPLPVSRVEERSIPAGEECANPGAAQPCAGSNSPERSWK